MKVYKQIFAVLILLLLSFSAANAQKLLIYGVPKTDSAVEVTGKMEPVSFSGTTVYARTLEFGDYFLQFGPQKVGKSKFVTGEVTIIGPEGEEKFSYTEDFNSYIYIKNGWEVVFNFEYGHRNPEKKATIVGGVDLTRPYVRPGDAQIKIDGEWYSNHWFIGLEGGKVTDYKVRLIPTGDDLGKAIIFSSKEVKTLTYVEIGPLIKLSDGTSILLK